jgi:hypothetical protein
VGIEERETEVIVATGTKRSRVVARPVVARIVGHRPDAIDHRRLVRSRSKAATWPSG